MNIRAQLVLLSVVAAFFWGCKKDEPVFESRVGQFVDSVRTIKSPELEVRFDAYANNKIFVPANQFYVNSSGDSFSVSKLTYYISNIKLKRSDGFVYVEPESYHLIEHVAKRTSFIIKNIPPGQYTSMEFIVGVDSARNVSGVQNGDLDIARDMFWDWNTGYIFYKLEGQYKNEQVTTAQDFAIHIGGFSGTFNVLQTGSVSFADSPVDPQKNRTSLLVIRANVEEVFNNPKKISILEYYIQNGPQMYRDIAANYKTMFKLDKVTN